MSQFDFMKIVCPHCGSEHVKPLLDKPMDTNTNGYCIDCNSTFYDFRFLDISGNRGLIQFLCWRIEMLEMRITKLEYEKEKENGTNEY